MPELIAPPATARLEFRWWSAADRAWALALWGDPAVTRLFSKEPWSDAQVDARLVLEMDHARTYGLQYWPMLRIDGGAFVGVCGLKPAQPEERIFEMGYHLLPAYWGQGLASEAGAAVVRLAFETLGIAALTAGHHPENAASGRVLEKLGFVRTGAELFAPTGLMHPAYRLGVRA